MEDYNGFKIQVGKYTVTRNFDREIFVFIGGEYIESWKVENCFQGFFVGLLMTQLWLHGHEKLWLWAHQFTNKDTNEHGVEFSVEQFEAI